MLTLALDSLKENLNSKHVSKKPTSIIYVLRQGKSLKIVIFIFVLHEFKGLGFSISDGSGFHIFTPRFTIDSVLV